MPTGRRLPFTAVVVFLLLALVTGLFVSPVSKPAAAASPDPDLYAVVQMPGKSEFSHIKSKVELVLDTSGLYAIVRCTHDQLDALVADGYVVIEQMTGTQPVCLEHFNSSGFPPAAAGLSGMPTPSSGGPDAAGYTYRDSDASRGPDFNWIDIEGSGNDTGISNDDQSVNVPIGFDFCFYGEPRNNVDISSNGYLCFNDDAWIWYNSCLPSKDDPDGIIAPFFDDLFPPCHGDIYFETRGSAGKRMFIVSWVDIPHISDCGTHLTFQAILYEGSNNIKFQYKTLTQGDPSYYYHFGQSATVGIEDDKGTRGLQYSCNSPSLTEGLAIQFYPGPKCAGERATPPALEKPRSSAYLAAPMCGLKTICVSPEVASAGQPITIAANVGNDGDAEGAFSAALMINGQIVETRTVSVGPHTAYPLSFTVYRDQPGTYMVNIGGKEAVFTVVGEGRTGSTGNSGGLIAIMVLAVLVIATGVVLTMALRRRPA